MITLIVSGTQSSSKYNSSCSLEIMIFPHNGLLFFSHLSASLIHDHFTWRNPGMVHSGRLCGPMIVMPIMASSTAGDGGIMIGSTRLAMSSMFK